jgi:hypothetical protein
VVIYLPSLAVAPRNTTTRVAEILTKLFDEGPGSFVRKGLPRDGSQSMLSDGQRIAREGVSLEPVLDLYTYDYRPRLKSSDIGGDGVVPAVRRLAFSLWYFLRALLLVLGARRHAKSTIAKWQLLIGFGAVVVLFLSVLFTAAAVLVALGVWDAPSASGNETAADAIAIGATAFTTWIIAAARPKVRSASVLLQRLLDYAEHDRQGAGVADGLGAALDELIEEDGTRRIHVVGYSLGALVAMDYLFPRVSDYPNLDPRHRARVKTLTTIGSPLDFVRLFMPEYTDGRVARVPKLRWRNVYIAADVFGSNFLDAADDAASEADASAKAISVAGVSPTSLRYTTERLTVRNIWGYRGFLSHGGYWDEVDRGNCLKVVHDAVLP